MSQGIWTQLNHLAALLAGLVLLGLVMLLANLEIKDMDLWLHLATGRYMVETGRIPHTDMLSATLAGRPWINHEWLFQGIIYWVYRAAGFEGLSTLQVFVVTVNFIFLFVWGYRSRQGFLPLFLLFCLLMVYHQRLTIRPDIFSLLFLTSYGIVLSRYWHRKAGMWILFGLQVLWNNMHGYFIWGPALVSLMLAGEFLKRHVPLPFHWNDVEGLTDGEYRRLKATLGLLVLACFLNPYGVQGALYPFKVLFSLSGDSAIFFRHVAELQKPITLETLFSFEYFYYKLLIGISVISFLINYRDIDIRWLMVWGVMFVFSLNATRNLIFFAWAAYVVIILNTRAIADRWAAGDYQTWWNIGQTVLLSLLLVGLVDKTDRLSLRGYFDFDRFERKSEYGGVSQRNFPTKAVDFLVGNHIQGRFFNDFNSGAYLLGRAFPGVRVFIDGRTEFYGADYFGRYLRVLKGDDRLFEQLADQYRLTGVFLTVPSMMTLPVFIRYLYQSPRWALVYFNYDAVIFLRNIPSNRRWIEGHSIDLSQWQAPKAPLLRIGLRRVPAYQFVRRATMLYHLGFYPRARQELAQARLIEDPDAESRRLLGKIALKEKRFQEAFVQLRKAKLMNPPDMETRYFLALALRGLGKSGMALKQASLILIRQPRNSQVKVLKAQLLLDKKQYDRAFDLLKEVPPAHWPRYTREIKDIYQTFRAAGEEEKARWILAKGEAYEQR